MEVRRTPTQLRRLLHSSARVRTVRSIEAEDLVRRSEDLISGGFGKADFILLATAKMKGIPVVTANYSMINQVVSGGPGNLRRQLLGDVRILVPGRDFTTNAELISLTLGRSS